MINTTIAKLALQALLGRRRFFLLLAFPVLLIGLVALVTALVDGDAAYEVLPNLGYPLVLPLVAILASSSVLGPEVDADFWQRVDHDHEAILAAIEAQDAEAAGLAMSQHLGHLSDAYTDGA